jgi:hypothetical protein
MTKDDSMLSSGAGSAARSRRTGGTIDANRRSMGRREGDDRWLEGRHQHRARGARPACGGRARRSAGDPLARQIRRAARSQLFRPAGCGQPLRAGSRGSRPQPRGQRLRHGRARARALCHGAGHVEGGHDLHTPVLGLRSGACAHPHGDRRRDRPGHDRKHLPPQDRLLGFRDRNAEADPDHRGRRARGLRRARALPWKRPHRGSRRWRRRRKTPR